MLQITDSELKKYIGSTNSLKSTDFDDTIQVVLNRYILPYLTEAQLNISAASDANIHLILMSVVKRAVANITVAKDYMKFALQFEVSGIKDKTTRETKATKEDKEAHRETFWKEGFASIDEMLKILENNKNTFTFWANSPTFTLLKNSFVNSTQIFNDIVYINDSRRTFLRLKSHIRTIEDLRIPLIVDPILLNSLKSKYQLGTLTPLENAIIIYIQSIVTNYAIADALIKGAIIKDKYNTFTVYDDTGLTKTEGYRTADKSLLEKAQQEYITTGQEYQLLMNRLIQGNLTELGLVKDSPKTEGLKPENDPKKDYAWI